jgi:tetratricopeptide (TPR) repeat protein
MKKLLLVAIVAWFVFVGVVFAQPEPEPSPSPTPQEIETVAPAPQPEDALSAAQKLEIQEILRNQFETGIDKTFGRTVTMLNFLIGIVIAIPTLLTFGAFLLRGSIRDKLIADIKKQLEDEIKEELGEEIKKDLKNKLEEYERLELSKQLKEFSRALEQLKSDTIYRFETTFTEVQIEKDRIIAMLSEITPLPSIDKEKKESVSPETKRLIQELTNKVKLISTNNPNLRLTANDHVQIGDSLYYEGKYEEAIACYDNAISLNPRNVFALSGRGNALNQLGRNKEALISLDKAIEIEPRSDWPWYNRSVALGSLGRYEESITNLKKAIELEPFFLEKAKTDHNFDSIRDDHRFKQLIQSFEAKQPEPEGDQD